MVFDRDHEKSDHEPDEWDPEEEYADPDSDSLTIPSVETENTGSGLREDLSRDLGGDVDVPSVSTSESDADPELVRSFWALVLVINGAVLALSLGVILLFFQGWSDYTAALFAGGVVLSGFAYRRYRIARGIAADVNEEADDPDEGEASPASDPDDAADANETSSDSDPEHQSPDDSDRR